MSLEEAVNYATALVQVISEQKEPNHTAAYKMAIALLELYAENQRLKAEINKHNINVNSGSIFGIPIIASDNLPNDTVTVTVNDKPQFIIKEIL